MTPEEKARTADRKVRTATESRIESAFTEYCDAWLDGKPPDLDAFCERHADCGSGLRPRIEEFVSIYYCFEESRKKEKGLSGPPPTDEPAVAGRKLGDFTLVREIGRGGMGVVYEAHQASLDRTVALKVLPAHLTLRKETIARFHREATTAARLKHPTFVEVHAVGEAEGNHYFAMEFVEGAPLDKVIELLALESDSPLTGHHFAAAIRKLQHRRKGEGGPGRVEGAQREPHSFWDRTYIEAACRIVSEVADALEYAHGEGVIHRDVKPSNIIVREDGSVVLTDFGLAREGSLPSLTITGELAGTPHYLAPEQASPRKSKVDHRVDVYSLGVTLYEMLTLLRPFEGRTSQEVLGQIVARQPSAPRAVNALIPKDIETICLTAMEKERSRRYQTAGAFREDLINFLAYRPILARPAGLSTRTYRLIRRHPGYAGLSVILLLFVIGGPLIYGYQHKQAATRIQAALDDKNDALAEKEQALLRAEEEADAARKISEYLESIFTEVYDCHAKGEEITAYELLERNLETLESRLADRPRLQAELMHRVALIQGIMGHHFEAEQLMMKALAAFHRVRGEDHPETIHCARHIGDIFMSMRRYDEAEPILSDCLEKCLAVFGEEHETTLDTAHSLANLYNHTGRIEEARPIYEKLLEHHRSQGADSHETIHFTIHLGEIEAVSGCFDEALVRLVECLERCRRLFGEDHSDVTRIRHFLAVLCEGRGRLKDAESFYGQLYDHCVKKGEDDPEAIHQQMHLGEIFAAGERYDEAVPLLGDCLDRCRRVLGDDDPFTNRVVAALANVNGGTGRVREADLHYEELLGRNEALIDRYVDSYGEDRIEIQYLKVQSASYLLQLGRPDEAEERLCAISDLVPTGHALALQVKTLQGRIHLDGSRFEDAETCFHEVLEETGPSPAGNPLAASHLEYQIAELYRRWGRAGEAELFYRRVIDAYRGVADADHPVLVRCLTTLAKILQEEGRFDEALAPAREAFEKTRPDHLRHAYRKALFRNIREKSAGSDAPGKTRFP